MIRFALLDAVGRQCRMRPSQPVDIDTAAKIYQDAAHARTGARLVGNDAGADTQMFSARRLGAALRSSSSPRSRPPPSAAFASTCSRRRRCTRSPQNLDAATVTKSEGIPGERSGPAHGGRRCRRGDARRSQIDKIMNGELAAPSTPKRDALVDKLEHASRSTESTVQIFLSMGQAVAIGTAIGSGLDPSSGRRARAQIRRSEPRGVGAETCACRCAASSPTAIAT